MPEATPCAASPPRSHVVIGGVEEGRSRPGSAAGARPALVIGGMDRGVARMADLLRRGADALPDRAQPYRGSHT